ncbi:hypothetical protein EDD37DRAFT_243423 [Exophiala viscosa]|uniref:Uncharacterized protein n=1 Tax=Exophiala viscosa TaxID=2486360 RepID=A0AAN6E734_9EURO|nr:hypothetical protein EDD36DRAFT_14770 [Exophiala viscosa]KAI1626986.1 hypothetical protein EDD37DRAFT_243423 [Exophiala viscosa]
MVSFNLAFLFHIVIEVPACLNFFLAPSGQLGTYTPHAHAVIRQYAVLILTSVLVAFVFLRQPPDETSAKVAAALAIYHIAPSIRSMSRLRRQAQSREAIVFSQASLYLIVHGICFAALTHHFWTAIQP